MTEKLKSFLENDSYFYVLLILLVGVVSFGLGRVSMVDFSRDTVTDPQIVMIEPLESNISLQNNGSVPVVVSKSGSKYHLLDCPGAKQMKEENKIEFESIEVAQAAGYTPAANCPGLQ